MLECFLLVGKVGGTWAPLIAIPAVIAGGVASMWLILSGIKGHHYRAATHPKRKVACAASSKRPQLRNVGQH